jgi:hypothetical protein
MKNLPYPILLPLIAPLLLIALLYQCNRQPETIRVTDTTQLDRVRDSASYAASIQRANYEQRLSELKPVRDTLYRTITKWKDRPVITEADRCDSCCEVGFQYMIAYEATSAALAACDTLQRTQEIVIQTDSTLLKMLHNTIAQERKNVAKERQKGTLKAIGSFVVGVFVGRGL